MAITQRTVEEAKAYIAESLKQWEEANQSKKIISLAAFAEKWRSVTGSPKAKMKSLQKSIKGLELIINRNENIDLPSPNLKNSLEALKKIYNELITKYGEPKTKRIKTLNELPKVE
jgi:hypothetical protein